MNFIPETFVKCEYNVSRDMPFGNGYIFYRFTLEIGEQKIAAFITEPFAGDVSEATAAKLKEIMERDAVMELQNILKRTMQDSFDADMNPALFVARRFGWRVLIAAAWKKLTGKVKA